MLCDGEATDFELRADLLVAREGQLFIAEVKTVTAWFGKAQVSSRAQLIAALWALE